MAKILFENKEDVYVDSSIPDKNKVKADDMNNIKEAVNTNENKILLAISDTAPSECATGDLYYNTTSKKIFEATGTNTWGTTGTNPTSNTIYILFDTKTTYSYDGTDLVSVGGGGAEVSVSTTEPTGDEDDSVKLWINPNEAPSGSLNPISNTYGVAQDKGYSQEYINGLNTPTLLATRNYATGWYDECTIPQDNKWIYIVVNGVSCESVLIPVSVAKTYTTASPYFIANKNGLTYQFAVGDNNGFAGLFRSEGGTDTNVRIYGIK
jgi:hypothetical protein